MKIRIGPDGPMKFCPGCRVSFLTWFRIQEAFDRDSTRSDGLRVYCRECRGSRRKVGRGR